MTEERNIPERNNLQVDNSSTVIKFVGEVKNEADFYTFLNWCKDQEIFGIKNKLDALSKTEISPDMRAYIVDYFRTDAQNNEFDRKALHDFRSKRANDAEKNVSFVISGTSIVLHAAGSTFTLTRDELDMCREGDIPSGLKGIGIEPESIVRAARSAILPEIHVNISTKDMVTGLIRNGQEGLVQWIKTHPAKKKDEPPSVVATDLIRFTGSIGPVYRIDGETRGIGLELNGVKYAPMPLDDFYALIRQQLSVPAPTMQKLKEVVNSWVNQVIDNGLAVDYRSSPIYVQDGIVRVDFPHIGDLQDIMAKLRDFHDKASHPLAYRTVLAWTLMAPLHDDLKRNARKIIQVPNGILEGKTKAGKTPLADFFIGRGYSMEKDQYFYSYERVATRFTLMKHLGMTNLPALLDDLPPDWIWQNRGNLKSYSQTGHFGDRGKSDQTINEYRGRRSFIGTVNDSIRKDDDLASANRLFILKYTEKNRLRKDLPAWNALIDGLPDGFMLEIFRILFEGQHIQDIARDVEKFQVPADWINYVIGKLNLLSQWFGIPEWPNFQEDSGADNDSNALEIAQAFLAEWERIEKNSQEFYDKSSETQIKAVKYRSPIEGEILVEWKGTRYYIWFTGGAFKTLAARQQLRLPYRNATDFLNNVASSDDGVRVENEGKPKSKKIGTVPLKAFCISIPLESEDDE